MKKIILSLLLALSFNANSQGIMQKGDIVVEGYSSIPNWANIFVFGTIKKHFDYVDNFSVGGSIFGFGGKAHYMVLDRLSVGIDINQETSGCSFDYKEYDSTLQLNVDFHVDYTSQKTRFLIRSDFHFINTDHLDMYIGLGLGYKHVKRTIVATEPHFDDQKLNIKGAIFPVASRIALGTRYYFTNNIGLFGELGVFGGSLLQAGLTVKF